MIRKRLRKKRVVERKVTPLVRTSPFSLDERRHYAALFYRQLAAMEDMDKKPLTKDDYKWLNTLDYALGAEGAIGRRFGRDKKDGKYMLALYYYRSRGDLAER